MGRFNTRHTRRGRGTGRKDRNKSNKEIKNKTLDDHWFYVGSSKQASDFETTYTFLVNYIKRTYTRGNDIMQKHYVKWNFQIQIPGNPH